MKRERTHPGLRAWADVTTAALALRRAGLRAADPKATPRTIGKRLAAELDRERARKLAAYARNG